MKTTGQREDRYSTIRYRIRRYLDISLAEYAFCDIAYHLAASRRSNTPGWANASNSYYGDQIGMTDRGIRKLKTRMITRGLIERHPDDEQQIRTTEKWEQAHVLGIEELEKQEEQSSSPKEEEQSSGQGGTEFRDGGNKVPGEEEPSSANSNRDSDSDIDLNSDTETALDWQAEVIKGIKDRQIRTDNIKNRAAIFELIEPLLENPGFKQQWRFMNAGLPEVNPKPVLRDWVTTAGWYEVSTFQINKIRGWIRTAAKKSNQHEYGKSQEPGSGSDPFDYGEEAANF